MIETAVALLDGRLADAERLALDALANAHPGSELRRVQRGTARRRVELERPR